MVLFTSERSGLPQILGFKMNTRELVQLTQEPTGARRPALAPDGTLFCATILWDGWAVVRAQPAALPAAPPRPRPELGRDTITTTSVQASGYRPWPSLLPHFWIPGWDDEGSAGRFAGPQIGGVDAIGRTAYYAWIGIAPANGRIEGALDVVHRRWKAAELSLSLQQTWEPAAGRVIVRSGARVDTVPATFGVRKQTARMGPSFLWRRWRASASASLQGEYERQKLEVDLPEPPPLTQPYSGSGGVLVTATAAYLSRPALAISPENGGALGALYRHRWETTASGWWDEWRGVGTLYLALSLPGFAHWVLAGRAAAGIRGGPSAGGYDLGGTSGDPYSIITGYALGPGRRLFPLRGYPAVGTRYTRAAVSAVELRIPLLLLGKGVGKLPLGFDRVSLSAFGEAGGGWVPGQPAAPFGLRDAGGELVIDAGIPQDVRFRARIGAGVPLLAGLGVASGTARWYLAFGSAF
jgi:hypothetical protein